MSSLVPVTDPALLERLRIAREQRDAIREAATAPAAPPPVDMTGMGLTPVTDQRTIAKLEMARSLRNQQYAPGPAIQQYMDMIKSGGRPGPGLADMAQAEDQGWFTKYVGGGLGSVAEGFLSGVPATMTLAGGLASKLGISGGADLADWGGDVQRYLDEKLSVEDENFYHQVMNGIGSMASFFLPGFGVASMVGKVGSASRFVVGGAEALAAARAAGTAVKLTKAGTLLQKGIQLGSMSILESGYEMADQMQGRIREGATAADAFDESGRVFWYNLPVLMATNFGYFSPGALAARMAIEAVSEGGQERYQALVQDVVNGRGKWSDFFSDKYWAETAVGAILGAGFTPLISKANEQAKEGGGALAGGIKPVAGPGFAAAGVPEGFETMTAPEAAGAPQANAAARPTAGPSAPAPVAQRQAQAQEQAPAAAATGVEPQDQPQTLDTPQQTTSQRRAADYRARRQAREARKLEFAHARADEQARAMVADKPLARQRALQALEDGLNELHGVTFQLDERLDSDQLDELADMAVRGISHADAFDRTTLAALTVARANEMLFRGVKAGQQTDTRLEFDAILNTDMAPPSPGIVGPTVAPKPVLAPQRAAAPAPVQKPAPPPRAAPTPTPPAAPAAAPASAVAPEPAPAPPPAPMTPAALDAEAKQAAPAPASKAPPGPVATRTGKPKAGSTMVVPIEAVTTNPEKLQTREDVGPEGYNEARVQSYVDNYDEQKMAMNPVVVWRNPKNGKLEVIDGHHRLETQRRVGKKMIEVMEFKGTEAEALKFSEEANDMRAANDPIARARTVRKWRDSGMTKKQIENDGKVLYGKDWPTVRALSYLNPKGKVIDVLRSVSASGEATNDILKVAGWIGQAREKYSTLTDIHEQEMFDYLSNNLGRKGLTNVNAFIEEVESRGLMGDFSKVEGLNLQKAMSMQTEKARFDVMVKEKNDEIANLKRQRAAEIKPYQDRLDSSMDPEETADLESAIDRLKVKWNNQISVVEADKVVLQNEWRAALDAGIKQSALFKLTPAAQLARVKKKLKITANLTQEPKAAGYAGISRMIRAFGLEPVYFESADDGAPRGYYEGGRVFLNLNTDAPFLLTAMHEVAHDIQVNDPETWAKLKAIALEEVGGEMGRTPVTDETVADLFAEACTKPEFWRKLRQREPSAFQHFLQEVLSMFKSIQAFLTQSGESLEPFFRDYSRIERAMQEAGIQKMVDATNDRIRDRVAADNASDQITLFKMNKVDRVLRRIEKSGETPEMKESMRRQVLAEENLSREQRMGFKDRMHHVYTQIVDPTHPCYVQVQRALKSAGHKITDLPIELNPQRYLQRLRGWSAKANMFIEFEVRSLDGKKILSEGLQPIIKKHGIAGAIDDGTFEQFYVAARYVSVQKVRGKAYFGEDPESESYKTNEANFAQHKKLYDQYRAKHPNWDAAVADFTTFSNAVMSLFADGDPETRMLKPEELQEVLDKYDIYAPLYLLEFAERQYAPGSKRPISGAGRPIIALGDMIPDAVRQRPISALIKKTYMVTHLVDQNRSKIALTDFIKAYGSESGGLVGMGRRIQRTQKPVFKSGEDLLRSLGFTYADHPLYQEYVDGGMTAEEAREFVREDMDRQFAEMGIDVGNKGIMNAVGKLWTLSSFQADGTIALMRNGEIEYWQIDPELWDVYMNTTAADNAIMQIFSKQTALLRAGAVLTPEFMGRNIFRDFVSASVISTGMVNNPLDVAVVPIRIIRGLRHAIKHDDKWKDFIMDGAGMAESVSFDVKKLQLRVDDLTRDYSLRGKSLRLVTDPVLIMKSILPTLQQLSTYSEQATRIAVHEQAVKKAAELGLTGEAARLYAMDQARESSTDFGRIGVQGAAFNKMIPFFNGNVQGLDKVYRTLFRGTKSERAAAWMRASYLITLPSILLWLSHHDEEWYQRAPGWLKNSCWLFSTNGGKSVIAIPKPFELGMLFGSLPERFLDHMYENDRKAMEEWAFSMYSMVNPLQFHQIAGPTIGAAIEDVANWDFFSGSNIVKGGLQNVEARSQYTASTSTLAKVLGDLAPGQGVSPQKIDHFLRASTGGLGMHASQIISWMYDESLGREAAAARPAAPKLWGGLIPSDAPVIGKLARSFERAQPEGYSRNIVDFYEMYDHANRVTASYSHLLKSGGDREAIADLIRREGEWVGAADIVNSHAKLISKMTAAIRAIEADRSGKYTPQEKRQMIDDLVEKRDYAARRSVSGILDELDKQKDSIRIDLEAAAARIRSGR